MIRLARWSPDGAQMEHRYAKDVPQMCLIPDQHSPCNVAKDIRTLGNSHGSTGYMNRKKRRGLDGEMITVYRGSLIPSNNRGTEYTLSSWMQMESTCQMDETALDDQVQLRMALMLNTASGRTIWIHSLTIFAWLIQPDVHHAARL